MSISVSDEKVIITGILLLAGMNYIWPGDHPIVNNVISGLLGYMTKMTVDMMRATSAPMPTSATTTDSTSTVTSTAPVVVVPTPTGAGLPSAGPGITGAIK